MLDSYIGERMISTINMNNGIKGLIVEGDSWHSLRIIHPRYRG